MKIMTRKLIKCPPKDDQNQKYRYVETRRKLTFNIFDKRNDSVSP